MILSSSLDQPLPFDTKAIFDHIDAIVLQAVKDGDPSAAFETAKTIIKVARLSGLTLAKLLYEIKEVWEEFGIDKDFFDYTFLETGLQKITITRYVRTWKMLSSGEIPQELIYELQARNIKDLNAISIVWESGYPIDEPTWKKLVEAPDNSEVLEALRELRGREPRRGSAIIKLERNGNLRVWPGGKFIGYLEVKSEDEQVKKAIQRIVNNSGIITE